MNMKRESAPGAEQAEKKNKSIAYTKELLSNASAIRYTTEFLEDNPDINPDELNGLLLDSDCDSDMTKSIVSELIETQKKVNQLTSSLDEKDKQSLLNLLVDSEDNIKNVLIGNIEIFKDFPLATVILFDNNIDYERVRKGSQGSFASVTIQSAENGNSGAELTSGKFPLILIGPINSEEDLRALLDHEKGHAKNKIVKNALKEVDKKFSWGGDYHFGDILKYVEKLEQDFDGTNLKEEYEKVLKYLLSKTKDEILAKLDSDGGVSDYMNGIAKGKLLGYDYINKLGIDKSSPLGRELNTDYLNQIQSINENITNDINKIAEAYMTFNLKRRFELFVLCLAQIPIDDWREKIVNETEFLEEANDLLEIKKIITKNISEDHYSDTVQVMVNKCQNNSSGLLNEYINDAKADLANIS